MPIDIKMPALSPTMEQGTLAKWLVKEGDAVKSGDVLAEIETDKATMEFEAVDEGTIASIAVAEGSEGVAVGTVIATLAGDDEDAAAAPAPAATPPTPASTAAATPARAAAVSDATTAPADTAPVAVATPAPAKAAAANGAAHDGAGRVIASPLARRIAAEKGIDLAGLTGSGPRGRIVKADLDDAAPGAAAAKPAKPAPAAEAAAPAKAAPPPAPAVEIAGDTRALLDPQVPHAIEKLSNMRKTIARRLVQSKQDAPHIYLTVDVQLGKLLALRGEVNAALDSQKIKVSVNDMLVKALAKALIAVPECNVAFAGAELIRYARADISVAVSIRNGLITPIVRDADGRSLSSIARATKDLAGRAREGKLKPEEYQGGTASISNMGMMGIKQFAAVINPPQGMILAVGAGEKRAWPLPDGTLGIADVMSATGSFDHRAIDGADGARLMDAFRALVEAPLGLLA